MTHICVSKLNIIGSDNGLSPGRCQAIIWTNTGILLIWPSGTNFSEMLIEIHTFLLKKMHVKISSVKRRPFCLGLHDDIIKWKNFLRYWPFVRGIHRSPVNSPHMGQWWGALIFSLICVWINSWVNNHEAGDLRCYHAHYDVRVMQCVKEPGHQYPGQWPSSPGIFSASVPEGFIFKQFRFSSLYNKHILQIPS